MNKSNKLMLLAATSVASVGVTAGVIGSNANNMKGASAATPTTVTAEEIASYYSSISDSASGDTLLNALHTLNSSKRKKTVGYNGMRTFSAKCDVNPESGNKIVGFYDNQLIGPSWDSAATWNREHVWPNSRGGSKVEADAHMIRPASTKTNGDRGNDFYGTSVYDPGQFVAEYRGIAARIIFYCAIADTSLTIVDKTNDNASNNTMGKLSDLLKWNLEYAPNASSSASLAYKVEQNRNNVIQKDSSGQGNRNPFIDHPEYACKIWGNTNETTKKICAGQTGGGGSGTGGEGGGGGSQDDGNKTNHKGTQADPYSVTDAISLVDNMGTTDYIVGEVTSEEISQGKEGDYKFHIKDSKNNLYVFYGKPYSGMPALAAGKIVLLQGQVINYQGTIEASKPKIISVSDSYPEGWKEAGTGGGGSGTGGGGGSGQGDDGGKAKGCFGSIIGAGSIAVTVSALGGFLFLLKRRKEEK